ncbi:sigma factor-like helix-turn-helix DNA-binding protein [Nocardiopsis ganjiahuensis]|uniref:sigma factor-like helix-turn-helix DNA-binding protein n=1 Tax=Nocardiopsis ganjiahuensis TaxID=239984 RepID=UPI00034C13DD|nr:sigma factor-like helix-turn-helix DNA-binding protein [Nocardiopsis ganjiahuensis]
MSTDQTWAAPTVEGVENVHRGVALDETEHAREALFRRGWDPFSEGGEQPAPATGPFGGAADHRALATATRRLPPEERRVVRMRLSGHDCAGTIADVLGLPRPRVALLLDRGLSRIRHDLLT